MKDYFVLIGKVPPPIGGVRVHVARLISFLRKYSYDFHYIDLTGKNLLLSLRSIYFARFIHLHTSNPLVRLFFSIICFIFRQKLVITYHGNIGRFGLLLNLFDYISIKLAYLPITLNSNSYNVSQRLNKKSCMVSAFIPPSPDDAQDILSVDYVALLRTLNCDYFFCTNAYGVTYDKLGREIYGILPLVKIFNAHANLGLVISDPSGAYKRYFKENNISLNKNIIVLDFPHSFINVIKNTDCMIRATATDGDSISVKEALFYDKPVIASDCVERPHGCILYPVQKFADLELLIERFSPPTTIDKNVNDFTGLENLLELYRNI